MRTRQKANIRCDACTLSLDKEFPPNRIEFAKFLFSLIIAGVSDISTTHRQIWSTSTRTRPFVLAFTRLFGTANTTRFVWLMNGNSVHGRELRRIDTSHRHSRTERSLPCRVRTNAFLTHARARSVVAWANTNCFPLPPTQHTHTAITPSTSIDSRKLEWNQFLLPVKCDALHTQTHTIQFHSTLFSAIFVSFVLRLQCEILPFRRPCKSKSVNWMSFDVRSKNIRLSQHTRTNSIQSNGVFERNTTLRRLLWDLDSSNSFSPCCAHDFSCCFHRGTAARRDKFKQENTGENYYEKSCSFEPTTTTSNTRKAMRELEKTQKVSKHSLPPSVWRNELAGACRCTTVRPMCCSNSQFINIFFALRLPPNGKLTNKHRRTPEIGDRISCEETKNLQRGSCCFGTFFFFVKTLIRKLCRWINTRFLVWWTHRDWLGVVMNCHRETAIRCNAFGRWQWRTGHRPVIEFNLFFPEFIFNFCPQFGLDSSN